MELRDWSVLPSKSLEKITSKLSGNFADIIRFGAVCTSWRSVSLLQRQKTGKLIQCLPWLILSHHKTNVDCHSFFSLSDDRDYWLQLSIPHNGRVCGTSNGWLVIVDETLGVSLLNPVTKAKISLPTLMTFPGLSKFLEDNWNNLNLVRIQDMLIQKALVSSSRPNLSDGIVVIISYNSISICKLGNKSWKLKRTKVDHSDHYEKVTYDDVVYSEGKLYAVTRYGRVFAFEGSSFPSEEMLKYVGEIKGKDMYRADKNYLVESSGELLMVSRFRGWSYDLDKAYETELFRVFKRNGVDWEQVKHIGDCSLFLGRNGSFSILASEHCGILKPNCIYFTDNCSRSLGPDAVEVKHHDVGIFNLVDGHVEPLPGYTRDPCFVSQPPMWVTISAWSRMIF